MILVTGATGNVGGAVVDQLLAAGHAVRALARDPAKLGKLAGRIEIVKGDLAKPETLAAAFAGVDEAFVMGAGGDLPTLVGNAVGAAKEAGAPHIVMLSSGTAVAKQESIIGRWHVEAEAIVKASGLAWTMLQPGAFASNTLHWAGSIKAQGAVFLPFGDGKSTMIDPRDIAEVAVLALTTPGHAGKSYLLSGSEALSTAEKVAKISAAIGKPLRYVAVTDDDARAGMEKAGFPELLIRAMQELAVEVRAGRGGQVSPVFEQLVGRAPRSYDAWLESNAAAFR